MEPWFFFSVEFVALLHLGHKFMCKKFSLQLSVWTLSLKEVPSFCLHSFAHVSGGDALHQMKTENRNLTQNLTVRAVHAVEVKRKSLEKGEGESFSWNFSVLYSSPWLFGGWLTLFTDKSLSIGWQSIFFLTYALVSNPSCLYFGFALSTLWSTRPRVLIWLVLLYVACISQWFTCRFEELLL